MIPLYFAYGSNMYKDRIENRIGYLGDFTNLGNHTLKGFKLSFNCGLFSIVANMDKQLEGEIQGVLYKINNKQIAVLDRYEGYPNAYEKFYFFVDPTTIAYAYVSTQEFKNYSNKPPFHDYLNTLILGAEENELKETYDALIAYEKKHFKIKCKKRLSYDPTRSEKLRLQILLDSYSRKGRKK